MAIKTVNSENLAEFVAQRHPKTADISTHAQMEEAVRPLIPQEPVKVGEETVSTSPDPGNQEPSAKKGVKPVQPRIDELVREKKEADEFAQSEYELRIAAERRIAELEEQVKAAPPPKVEAEPELVEPDPKKYTDQEAFNKDWKDYQSKVIDQRVSQRLNAERAAEHERLANALLAERVSRARGTYEDFDSVVEAGEKSNRMVPLHVKLAISEATYGPEIAYYLLKNPKEEARIFKLSRMDALLELGEIAKDFKPKAKEEAMPDPEPQRPPQTRAPAPITSLKGEGGVIPVDLSKPMPFLEYKRLSIQEKRANRR